MSIAYLLMGSNLGHRWSHLCDAADAISRSAGEIMELSKVYESPSWGFDHPSHFLNQAIKLKTRLNPDDLLKNILSIETMLGRKRETGGYEARTIDIDILFYDELVIDKQELTIPHPRLHQRRFTLLPLADIAEDHVHPENGLSIKDLLHTCADNSTVRLYNDQKERNRDEV